MTDYRFMGNGSFNTVSKVNTDSPYSIAAGDATILCDASSGALTVTLPTAVGRAGKKYAIRRTDILSSANLVTIATISSQTISGSSNHYLWPAEHLVVVSDGANWEVIDRSSPSMWGYYFDKGSTDNRRYVAGLCSNTSLITSTTSPANNTLWAIPFIVAKTTKFDTITFVVTTNAACNARCGIYRDKGNCYPGALIFDTSSIDCSSGSNKDTAITAGLQVLPPGLYWLTWECDTANIQIRALPGSISIVPFLGNANSMSANPPGYAYSVAHTYGSLPDPYTASASIITAQSSVSAPIPAIGLRPI